MGARLESGYAGLEIKYTELSWAPVCINRLSQRGAAALHGFQMIFACLTPLAAIRVEREALGLLPAGWMS